VLHCKGTANKNIGDAFLLTWKLDEVQTEEEQCLLADQALLSFLRTLIEINRYKDFVCDFTKPAVDRLRDRFRGHYQVKMGFGLHVGWAIEGAIGSSRKIDASYISPHVNMTEFLESSTKQYGKLSDCRMAVCALTSASIVDMRQPIMWSSGCTIMMSQPFFDLLSDEAKQCCRQVDRILKPDIADDAIGLFTYDVDLTIDFKKDVRYADQGTEHVRSNF
jgi:class 3 adenylate cyclase